MLSFSFGNRTNQVDLAYKCQYSNLHRTDNIIATLAYSFGVGVDTRPHGRGHTPCYRGIAIVRAAAVQSRQKGPNYSGGSPQHPMLVPMPTLGGMRNIEPFRNSPSRISPCRPIEGRNLYGAALRTRPLRSVKDTQSGRAEHPAAPGK